MTNKKAIEILRIVLQDGVLHELLDFEEAVQRGLQALEFFEAMDSCPYCKVPFTLPGETKG